MLQRNYDITALTSFGIATRAAAYGTFKSVDELKELLEETKALTAQAAPLILGGGSNLLFTSNYGGAVLHNCIDGIDEQALPGNKVTITCGAGVNWHRLVMHCVARNYGGIENLALIPGSCGAAPIQNIGAYGVELTDVFHSLQAYHMYDGSIETFSHADCRFGYRDSVFKHRYKGQWGICSITLMLNTAPAPNISYTALADYLAQHQIESPTIAQVANAVIAIRQSKLPDPRQVGNAGSFFKNPVVSAQQFNALRHEHPDIPHFINGPDEIKIPAAWLIEQCGWKGYRHRDAGVHHRQALVLVNYGNASGTEIFTLSERIMQSVQQRFRITLEREVNVI